VRVQNYRIGDGPDLERASLHGAATVSEGVVALQDDFAGCNQVVECVDGFSVLSLYITLLVGMKIWTKNDLRLQ